MFYKFASECVEGVRIIKVIKMVLEGKSLQEKAMEVFKVVEDPELKIDIWTLGLIYDHQLDEQGNIKIKMTFTSPGCPYGPMLLSDLEETLLAVGIKSVSFEIVYEPPWEPSEEVKEMLGLI